MENTTLTGRLGREPEMRYTPSGKAVTEFSVAIQEKVNGEKATKWVRVTTWNKLAEVCNQYLHKGRRVAVTGRYDFDAKTGSPKVFQRKDGSWGSAFDFTASNVEFLDSANGENEAAGEAATEAQEEEIPF